MTPPGDRDVPMTCVYVEQATGSYSCTRATIDMFHENELTVSAIDDGFVMRVFLPGTWQEARVLDERGYPLFTFHHGRDPKLTMAKAHLPATEQRA